MVNAIGSSSGLGAITTSSDRARITREQFIQLLTAELSSQSPLDPVDNAQFLDQLVAMQNLETSAATADSMRSLTSFLQLNAGSSLIGRIVRGISDTGIEVRGLVTRVLMDGSNVRLVIGDQVTMPLAGVREVSLF
ncbi:MAG: hypothetical protein A2W17_02740 [Planctomycetes bacterium RBG_16_41_13]|nr:MAG: hypothetical protein A2W17_02740 [Planctomycetes bacterium RBG_16_41_13]